MPPFPNAHWYVGAFLAVTFAAFLPSYFAVLPQAPWVHHLHGVTATAWIVLVMAQSWSAHRGRWRLHRWCGMASLPLLPIFTVGGMLVTLHTLSKDTAFKALFGEALSVADLLVSAAFVAFYMLALRHRRTPALHARYMLSTVILLAGPSLARLFANFVPGFLVRGPETLPRFGAALDASFIVASAFCIVLILRDLRDGQPVAPFVAALFATLGMVLGYYAIGYSASYSTVADWIAAQPAWTVAAFALVTSSAATWWGWRHPKPRQHGRPRAEVSAVAD